MFSMEPLVLLMVLAVTLSLAFVLAAGSLTLVFRAMVPARAGRQNFRRHEENLPASVR
jgi:hypothetical protein